MDLQIEQFKHTFFQECDELLANLEYQLSLLKVDSSDVEPLHAAFRAIHSLKGGAGMFGFVRLVDFAHNFENALRLMRSGAVAITENVIDAAIQAGDVVADLVHAARTGTELASAYEADAAERLAAAVGIPMEGIGSEAKFANTHAEPPMIRPVGVAPHPPDTSSGPGHRYVYRICFRPRRRLLQRLNEPLLIIRHLRELGGLTVEVDVSGLPAFADLAPTDAYLAWTLTLESDAGLAAVKEAFEFVEGDCELAIDCLEDRGPPVCATSAVEADPEAWTNAPASGGPKSAVLAVAAGGRGHGASSIRVDLDRIDRLVNMVGEIAVSQTMVYQHIDQSLTVSNPRLFNELSQLLKLTQSLQDSVMAIRAQPVRAIFARMPRVVRELVSQTGKKIVLETSGEETEIDKTLIEQLGDPLTHMIRNAVDHGIEPVEERAVNGKPEQGTIRISAAQRGSQIVIEVSDDGRGIDHEKIRQKAIELGLISADAKLSDEEIYNLVFAPGFSTAEKVTSISGRGVGMDVVKRNIQKLGGRVSISSDPGRGSKVTLTLPLTLAVTDAMIIRVGGESYAIPIASIVECLAVSRQQVKGIPGSGEVLNVRGTHVRVIRLSTLFHKSAIAPSPQQLVILVEVDGGELAALVVDEIVGQQQVVMKSIRENFDQVAGVAGATILGNGAIALFLDVAAIAEISAVRGSRRFRSGPHANAGRQVA